MLRAYCLSPSHSEDEAVLMCSIIVFGKSRKKEEPSKNDVVDLKWPIRISRDFDGVPMDLCIITLLLF